MHDTYYMSSNEKEKRGLTGPQQSCGSSAIWSDLQRHSTKHLTPGNDATSALLLTPPARKGNNHKACQIRNQVLLRHALEYNLFFITQLQPVTLKPHLSELTGCNLGVKCFRTLTDLHKYLNSWGVKQELLPSWTSPKSSTAVWGSERTQYIKPRAQNVICYRNFVREHWYIY